MIKWIQSLIGFPCNRLGFLCLLVAVGAAVQRAEAVNGFYLEYYADISGDTVSALTGAAIYPDYPTREAIYERDFYADSEIGDYYGQRARAILTPTVSGSYTFYLASDDQGELWISSNDSPLNKTRIVSHTGWSNAQEWTKNASQKSSSVMLNAGQRYYIEALMKENNGGDNLAVGWVVPGTSGIAVVPQAVITPYLDPPVITQQPVSVEIDRQWTGLHEAVFSIAVKRQSGITCQWFENGTEISGATDLSYRFTATEERSGHTFTCRVTNLGGTVTSSGATFRLIDDTRPPQWTGWSLQSNPHFILLHFSEPLAASAFSAASYTLTDHEIRSVRAANDGQCVVIELEEALEPGQTCRLSGSVSDCAVPPNTLTISDTPLNPARFATLPDRLVRGPVETPGPSSRRNPVAITEIHAAPAARSDGRDLRFIELFNSNPYLQRIGGYTLSGSISYTFPTNAVLAGKGYIVIAASASDITAVYGISNVIQADTCTLTLPGTVTLTDEMGAWISTIEFADDAPWPAGINGSGHSLVLAAPSYGERYADGWARSSFTTPTPGKNDLTRSTSYAGLLINEILPHGPDAAGFVELINISGATISLNGCSLIRRGSNATAYAFPNGTSIAAHALLSISEDDLGFVLNGAGDELWLRAPTSMNNSLIDAVRLPAIEIGVSYGRTPDGGPLMSRLTAPTPGTRNHARRSSDVILNEIMYHPITESKDDEYVELLNTTDAPIPLAGWSLTEGISYTFETETIPANGFLVVPRSKKALKALYPFITPYLAAENYSGSLSNDRETLRLNRPMTVFDAESGQSVVRPVTVEMVTYRDGGAWGATADGGGSSLERINPRSDPRLAQSWACSDETGKSEWVTLTYTGALEMGTDGSNCGKPIEFQLGLQGEGECLIDEVVLRKENGGNLVMNPSFESGRTSWTFYGTHSESGVEPNDGATDGSHVLHVRATDRLHTGANGIRGALSDNLGTSGRATISMKARWLSGCPEILARARGNWIEVCGVLPTTRAMGTPGAANSRAARNAPPSIREVTHDPILPRNGEAVSVYAQIDDADGILNATLVYRNEKDVNSSRVAMTRCESGWFKGVIPAGQANNALIRFSVEATDAAETASGSRFPTLAKRDCLVRYNEPLSSFSLGTYRFWITSQMLGEWGSSTRGNNSPFDITFVYGNDRVCYESGAYYGGSPFHSNFSAPINNGAIDYKVVFTKDDTILDADSMVLATTGNLGDDGCAVREHFIYSLARALRLPHAYRRFVHLYANGAIQNGQHVIEDTEKPGGDMIKHFYPDASDGDLYKVDDWFEYQQDFSGFNYVTATMNSFKTTDPETNQSVYKLARYRWNWLKRAAPNFTINDYSKFFDLVTAMNLTGTDQDRATEGLVDRHGYTGVLALNQYVGNYDSYGKARGKNMYLYEGPSGWSLITWDMDFNFGQSRNLNETIDPFNNSYESHDSVVKQFLRRPVNTRAFWRNVIRMEQASRSGSDERNEAEAKYQALIADGVQLSSSCSSFMSSVETRRGYVESEIRSRNATSFAILTPSGSPAQVGENRVTLTGLAPFEVVTITIDGMPVSVTWTSPTNWTAEAILTQGTSTLTCTAFTETGDFFAECTKTIRYTGAPLDPPDTHLVFSEINCLPLQPGSGYIEVCNASTNTIMDLTGFTVDGAIHFAFPDHFRLNPGTCAIVAEDRDAFIAVYGNVSTLAGACDGTLPPSGTLLLRRPATGMELEDPVIDSVTYGGPGWPVPAPGCPYLLMHPLADNARAAEWCVPDASEDPLAIRELVPWNHLWRYLIDDPGTGWNTVGFDDSSWNTGIGPLGYDSSVQNGMDIPFATTIPIVNGRITYYFRTTFTYTGNTPNASLLLSHILDDGAVFYLNGVEIHRSYYMPSGTITDTTVTTTYRPHDQEGKIEGPFVISPDLLVQGVNTLAVDVHQNQTASSDLTFGMWLGITNPATRVASPGKSNQLATLAPPLPPITLNEIQTIPGAGQTDGFTAPWVELYNPTAETVDLAGWRLAQALDDPGTTLPEGFTLAPGAFRVIWLDGDASQSTPDALHTAFTFAGDTLGTLLLLAPQEETFVCVDALTFSGMTADRSFGCYPDGQVATRRFLSIQTPGEPNRTAHPARRIAINEFMAQNATFVNPLTGAMDDWFELINDGTEIVDLGGWLVTDTLKSENPPTPNTKATKSITLPAGLTLAPGETLRVWTGIDDPAALPVDPANLQAPFGLGKNGDQICLFDPELNLVDRVTYTTAQSEAASCGRWPNGSGEWTLFPVPTPGEPNRPPRFPNAILSGTLSQTLLEEIPAAITNKTNQRITNAIYQLQPELGETLPEGLTADASGRVLSWTPTEAQGPGAYYFTLYLMKDGECLDAAPLVLTVLETTHAPKIAAIANQTVNEGATITFTLPVTRDEEIPPRALSTLLTMTAGEALSNAVFNAQTGVFTWTTGEIDGPGTYPVTFTAKDADNDDAVTSVTVTLTVKEVNSPSTYLSPTRFYLWSGETFDTVLKFEDPDLPPNAPTFRLMEGPDGLTLDPDTGRVCWTPSQSGSFKLRFRYFDNGGYAKTFEIPISVDTATLTLSACAAQAGGEIRFEWTGKADTRYIVEWCDDLMTRDWQPVPDLEIAGKNGLLAATLNPAALGRPVSKAFFRIRQVRD